MGRVLGQENFVLTLARMHVFEDSAEVGAIDAKQFSSVVHRQTQALSAQELQSIILGHFAVSISLSNSFLSWSSGVLKVVLPFIIL